MSEGKPIKASTIFDGVFIFLAILAVLSALLAVWLEGTPVLGQAAEILIRDTLIILPMIALGITVGSLFTVLVPREVISRYLGHQAGMRGILIATFVGTVMPAGPFAAFPLVLALGRSGASIGALIAFLTAWAAVGLNRLLIWELPFMGAEFSLLRFVTSLPIPIIAGLLAQKLSQLPAFQMNWEKR